MAEMNEVRIEEAKAAVEHMRRAQSTMQKVLDRNRVLEQALGNAISNMRSHKAFVPENAHLYSAGGKTLHETIDAHVASAQAALG